MTIALRLILGIPAIPTDNNSAEQGVEVISLAADGNSNTGFFLDETVPFMPKIAGLKGGGVWIDSAADDGRALQNDSVGNVTETINLKLQGTFQSRYSYLSQLNRFADEARKFHTTHYQTRPVQLEWWAEGAPGPQYALIYDMSIDVQRAAYDQSTSFDITLSLEREPAWRGILFGWPATIWTQYMRGNTLGAGYDLVDLGIIGGDALVQATAQNRHEFLGATGYDYDSGLQSKNYVEIDAELIPGDAPALVSIGMLTNSQSYYEMFIARSTKPKFWVADDGSKVPQFYTLNAADSGDYNNNGNGSLVAGTSANGVIGNGSSTQQYYWLQSASVALHTLSWGNPLGLSLRSEYGLNREQMRGRFAAFIRGRLDTTTPATFSLNQFRFGKGGVSTIKLIEDYQPAAPASSTVETIFYLGDFIMPPGKRSSITPAGLGISMEPINDFGDLILELEVTPGNTTQNTRVMDLVLLPYDEAQIIMVSDEAPGTVIYDGTGMMARDIEDFIGTGSIQLELRGSSITLEPKTDNRLYFMGIGRASTDKDSMHDQEWDIEVNIIPRWYGVRDV